MVLDDFQVIQDRFILQVLETLVTNLPHSLHLALLTREDPPLLWFHCCPERQPPLHIELSQLQPPGATRGEPLAPNVLIEPLTDRELDVLRLMAEGLKYREIAARLFVSLNTVRFHVKAIYGKLDANNRTKAIEIARRLNIL